MYMKIISFDIGIKNMAYCLFDISEKAKEDGDKENLPKIIDWKVLSLLAEEPKIHKCSCPSKITKKNIAPPPCGRKAKFSHTRENNQIFLCDKHAKSLVKDSAYLMPETRFKNVKKNNMDGLLDLATEFKITELPKNPSNGLLDDIFLFKFILVGGFAIELIFLKDDTIEINIRVGIA